MTLLHHWHSSLPWVLLYHDCFSLWFPWQHFVVTDDNFEVFHTTYFWQQFFVISMATFCCHHGSWKARPLCPRSVNVLIFFDFVWYGSIFMTSRGFCTLFLPIIIILISMETFYYHFPSVLPLYFIPSFYFQKCPFVSHGNTLVVNSKKTRTYRGNDVIWPLCVRAAVQTTGHSTIVPTSKYSSRFTFWFIRSCAKGVRNTG